MLIARRGMVVGVLALGLIGGPQMRLCAVETDPDVLALLERVDDLLRGDSSQGQMTMRVKTARFERRLTMESWSKGTDKSLVRILEPAKERGTATLKVENNIWNYLPKVDRTIKVPASMMGASWMGSHFTNDDLIQNARYSRDFECGHVSPTDEDVWTIDCVPHETAAVVWGKVSLDIRRSDELPSEARFYDERDNLARTMVYEDVQDLGGHRLPTRMRVIPADEPDEFTEIVYDRLQLDVEVPDRTFTLQALKR